MKNYRIRKTAAAPRGFTLVELLVVIAIIGILISLLVPTFGMINETLVRTQCAGNLKKMHLIFKEYAASHSGMLPPISGSNNINGIQQPGDMRASPHNWYIPGSNNEHTTGELLKKYGATAATFTCPASPVYKDNAHYKWNSWKIKDWSKSGTKKLWTDGYVFFIRTWGYSFSKNGNTSRQPYNWGGSFVDRRALAERISDDPNLPIVTDELRWNMEGNPYYQGWYHFKDRDGDTPGGGGHTLFLSGAVNWFDWGHFDAELDEGLQPYWYGNSSWKKWQYFIGRYPKGVKDE